MSRRHTSTPHASGLTRALAAALSLALLVVAIVPAAASAQVRDTDLQQEWQLLTYRAESGKQEPVRDGVGARILPFAGERVLGEAACSSYEAGYDRPGGNNLFFRDVEPEYVDCDPASQDFDELFYQYLADTASFKIDGSILRLYDNIETVLMVLTSAKIDDDPTVARWNLARVGGADGSVEPVIRGLNPWIEFLPGGSVVGQSACGSFLGTYATLSGTMDVSEVRYRLRDCIESTLDQAERTIGTLAEVTNYEVRPAGLVLQDENRTTRLALTPDIGLNRRTWTPTAIYDPGRGVNAKPLFEGDELATSAVQFDGPRAEGSTICRPFTAKSLRSGLALDVDESTWKWQGDPCPKKSKNARLDYIGIETAFRDALLGAASHALRGSELELKDVDGNTLMRLEPQAELVGPTWVVSRLGKKKLRKTVGDIPITVTFDEIGIVDGDTGAGTAAEKNYYSAFYTLPAATRVNVEAINANSDVEGRACKRGNKRKQTPVCKQELAFLQLLSEVDTYIVKPHILRLRIGNRTVMELEPEQLVDLRNAGDLE